MALDSSAKQALKTALQGIDPTKDDIIDMMIDAFDEWVKKAKITVTVPAEIPVKVDLKTGEGVITQSIELTATIE